jgi:hypothetical protein
VTEAHWLHDPHTPYATLLRVVHTYCDPQADADAYEALRRRARRGEPGGPEMMVFRRELAELLAGAWVRLPPGALHEAVGYDEADDVAFLRRLWRDLYGDDPVPG